MEFEKLANPNRLLPSHLIGKVVSSPLQCLPIVSAITVKNTTELSLGHKGIEELEGFGLFTNLETLWLNGNRLQRINGLDTNKRIKKLYASKNQINSLKGSLLAFKHIEELDLSDNSLSNLDRCLETLELFMLLRKLWLQNNPISQEVDYRLRVLARIPSLEILDNHIITAVERSDAVAKYGFLTKGGTAIRAAHEQKTLESAQWNVFSYNNVPKNSNLGACAQGGYAPDTGFGRTSGSLSATLQSVGGAPIVFGVESGKTSVQRTFAKEVKDVLRKRLHQKLEKTAQEFANAKNRSDWVKTMNESETSGATASLFTGTFTGVSSPLVASALINITHPILTEDVVTRNTRKAMLARNVEPELLSQRESFISPPSALHDDSAKAQMLTALAPVIPNSRATHPITDPTLIGFDSVSASQHSSLSASLDTRKHHDEKLTKLFSSSQTMSKQLAATLASSGVQAISQVEIGKKVLASVGLRLKTTRTRSETFERYGLDERGNKLQSRQKTVDPVGMPLIPQIAAEGRLGEWDKYKLRKIFQESDVDGSGELSKDEIKGALSSCADYGFCVSIETESGADAMGASAALLSSRGKSISKMDKMLDSIFDAIDIDKSGTVTWREFIDVIETGIVAKKPINDSKPQKGKTGTKNATLPSLNPRPQSPRPKTPAEAAKERQDAILKEANALLSSARKKKEPEPTRVPQLKFRSLTSAEARERSERYFKLAAEAWRAFERVLPNQHDRDIQLKRLRAEMVSAGDHGNRLAYIADSLGGTNDPPEKMDAPPKPRHDWVFFTSLVPKVEEEKTHTRGNRHYKIPYPGDEFSRDEERTRSVLLPGPLELSLEDEYGGEELKARRLHLAASTLRTIHDPIFENYRLKEKSKAPHVVHKTVLHL
jgi:Ca2+-binding EF-hand superfamily protein